MFYVGDSLRRRMGMPGVNILLLLELGGTLDVEGFNRAVRALHRLYPATAASLERSRTFGRPRWRLDDPPESPGAWLETRRLDPATPEELHRQGERLLREPLDCRRRPPVQFVRLRGLGSGDVLAMRWPHFFADARGGMVLLEEIQRLYVERAEPGGIASAEDEKHDDAEELIREMGPAQRLRALFSSTGGARPAGARVLRLGDGRVSYDVRNLHYALRALDERQAERVRDAALRVCGFARVGDFVRACGIQALHRTLRPDPTARSGYLTAQLVDNRKRRQRGPVCHNFFSALPVYIPATVADDRKTTADRIAAATAEALSSGTIKRQYAALDRLRCLPPGAMIELTRAGIRGGPDSVLGRGLAKAPSLPMGFMGSFSRPMPEFCGASWENVYGIGVILPHEGLGLNLTTPNNPKRLNITATYFEPNVSKCKITEFLDQFVNALLDGG